MAGQFLAWLLLSKTRAQALTQGFGDHSSFQFDVPGLRLHE
jgi:hypothetical protein